MTPQFKFPVLGAVLVTLSLSAGGPSVVLAEVEAITSAAPAIARVLEVDRLGSGPYKTLAAAAKVVQPGETIRVKPGSGPYREVLAIRVSGTEANPITFDGGGNTITGFDVLAGWETKDGVTSTHLKNFPCVLCYQGERLLQDAATGQFTKYADLSPGQDTLTLRPGVGTEGWEISTRALAVAIGNVSHQIYRNVRASGSTNDGFNLHGTGSDLLFENVEGFHNFDEGFSSHDSIQSTIRGGKFWGNDNGIANSYVSRDTVSTTLFDTDCYDNLGFGLVLHDCAAALTRVRIWNNGMSQVRFNSAQIACDGLRVYTQPFTKRQYLSYTESKTSQGVIAYLADRATITGNPPVISPDPAPNLAKGIN